MRDIVAVATADWHVGALPGLTPPEYQVRSGTGERGWFGKLQRMGWDWFTNELKGIGEIDLALCVGDLVDGSGEKNSGRELLLPDVMEQVCAAGDVVRAIAPAHLALVRGSRYHVGKAIFLENALAKDLGVEVPLWAEKFRVAKTVFHLRHKIAKTSLWHTQGTALARAMLNDLINSLEAEQERADVVLRAHVHRYIQVEIGGMLGFTLPGLEFPETDFIAAECDGFGNWGFLEFRIPREGGRVVWRAHLLPHRLYARPISDALAAGRSFSGRCKA